MTRSPCLCCDWLQGTSGPDPTTVYVDMRALRHDRVRLVERGSPHSLPLMESGKVSSTEIQISVEVLNSGWVRTVCPLTAAE
ncbi:hypothetical protein INR49_026172 [Caranx melampygus]|nr:hypothetical protein INR49_026172 [Caranx melampygus]